MGVREQFAALVLADVQASYSASEWLAFRRRAGDVGRVLGMAEVVSGKVFDITLSVADMVAAYGEPERVGEIGGRGVLRYRRPGIYMHDPGDGGHLLMLWCSDPAYPVGW